MLKKDRDMVMNDVVNKLMYGLNNLTNFEGSFYAQTNGQNYSMKGYSGEIASPNEAYGWPPELQEYIKRVAIATAIAIVDSIYTEKELDAKVDGILLDSKPTPQ